MSRNLKDASTDMFTKRWPTLLERPQIRRVVAAKGLVLKGLHGLWLPMIASWVGALHVSCERAPGGRDWQARVAITGSPLWAGPALHRTTCTFSWVRPFDARAATPQMAPIQRGLEDRHPYVRRTAVMGVLKVYNFDAGAVRNAGARRQTLNHNASASLKSSNRKKTKACDGTPQCGCAPPNPKPQRLHKSRVLKL